MRTDAKKREQLRAKHTRQTFGFEGNVWNARWDHARKFKLSCTLFKSVFTNADRRQMKEVLGESWLGYYIKGGMPEEAKRILKMKRA